jgi:hypothetical protein
MAYCILKVSSAAVDPTPYRGPLCQLAGVQPAKVYFYPAAAAEDIQKLQKFTLNPVEFGIFPHKG